MCGGGHASSTGLHGMPLRAVPPPDCNPHWEATPQESTRGNVRVSEQDSARIPCIRVGRQPAFVTLRGTPGQPSRPAAGSWLERSGPRGGPSCGRPASHNGLHSSASPRGARRPGSWREAWPPSCLANGMLGACSRRVAPAAPGLSSGVVPFGRAWESESRQRSTRTRYQRCLEFRLEPRGLFRSGEAHLQGPLCNGGRAVNRACNPALACRNS